MVFYVNRLSSSKIIAVVKAVFCILVYINTASNFVSFKVFKPIQVLCPGESQTYRLFFCFHAIVFIVVLCLLGKKLKILPSSISTTPSMVSTGVKETINYE